MLRIYTLLICSLLATFAYSQDTTADAPKHEVRAVWLTTIGGIDWPHSYAQSERSVMKQKQELCNILDKLKQANINTVLLQTRIRGTVIYPSEYESWDGCLSGFPGKSPGYDPLLFAINECHKRGMELHAWIVTIPVGKWNAYGCRQLRNKYPSMIRKIGAEGYMNPESKQTAGYLADMCREITRNYDIDGIHLDYIRYPETWNIKISRQEGRENITSIVKAIYNAVKTEKAWVKMSCSPIGKFDDLTRFWSHGWNAYTKVCQDAQGWLRTGLMDALFPMMYFKGDQFYPFAIDWAEQSYGRIISAGLGIYFMHPSEKNWDLETITREMNVLRQYGMGHAFFRSKFFTDDVKGIYNYTANTFNRYPAMIPAMTWEEKKSPSSPLSMQVNVYENKTTLEWSGASNRNDSPYLLYNVYASEVYPVDVNDARNIISMRRKGTSISINTDKEYYYAVTAVDRYGNESEPLQMKKQTAIANKRLLKNDGIRLELPKKSSVLDADYITIESISGVVIATRSYSSNIVNISKLPEGVYTVRSINKRGITHRIGNFIIKR